ncbi:MAG: hypothetical protein Aseana_22040 [Candidatus Pelagadaptatus aseana]
MAFEFESGQTADRFLNRLKSGAIVGVKARRYRGATSILASYGAATHNAFDSTCQQLDDLAVSMGGYEISVS